MGDYAAKSLQNAVVEISKKININQWSMTHKNKLKDHITITEDQESLRK